MGPRWGQRYTWSCTWNSGKETDQLQGAAKFSFRDSKSRDMGHRSKRSKGSTARLPTLTDWKCANRESLVAFSFFSSEDMYRNFMISRACCSVSLVHQAAVVSDHLKSSPDDRKSYEDTHF